MINQISFTNNRVKVRQLFNLFHNAVGLTWINSRLDVLLSWRASLWVNSNFQRACAGHISAGIGLPAVLLHHLSEVGEKRRLSGQMDKIQKELDGAQWDLICGLLDSLYWELSTLSP
jgi:hypothetical protein